jgi:hypothetical protein
MDSGIHKQLALARLQDSLRDAETARSARAVPRLPQERRETRLATAWWRKRPAPALNGPAATTTVLRRRRFRTGA